MSLMLCLGLACGSGGDDTGPSGGVVSIKTGDTKPGPLPSDGLSVDGPTITSVAATSAAILPKTPLEVTVTFADPQHDVARVNLGLAGATTHQELAHASTLTETGFTLQLYFNNEKPGNYLLLLSLTDSAGHTSLAATLEFTILNVDGTQPGAGDAGRPADAAPGLADAAPGLADAAPGLADAGKKDATLATDTASRDGAVIDLAADKATTTDGPTLTCLNAKVGPSGTIKVSWTGGPANEKAWIAVYAVGTPDGSYLGAYQYTAGAATGSFSFPTPASAGSYEFRMFADNGYTRVASSTPFQVTNPYELDPGFATGGKLTFDFLGKAQQDWVSAVLPLSGGRAILVGTAKTGLKDAANGEQNEFALARLTAGGALDTTFGTGGKVHVALTSYGQLACTAAVLQKDGKILVGGYAYNTASTMDFVLARFTETGALDASFGSAGIVTTNFRTTDPGQWDKLLTLAVADNGSIFAGGEMELNAAYVRARAAIAKYSSSGVLDTTFGAAGTATLDLTAAAPGGQEVFDVNALIPNADGSLLAGLTAVSAYGRNDMAVAKLKADGTLDTTFATSGVLWETKPGTHNDQHLVSLERNASGALLLLGHDLWGYFLSRYSAAGVLDATLGQVVVDPSGSYDIPVGLLHPADGTLLVPLSANAADGASVSGDFGLTRHSADGKLDDIFGKPAWKWGNGTTIQGSRVYAAAVLDSGAVLLAGFLEVTGGGDRDFAVMRLVKAAGF